MSLETGLILAEKAFRYTSGIVKTPVVKKSEIVLSSLKPAIGDVCTFAKTDPTLFPGFVKDLLKTEGTGIKRVKTITKRLLERMGYNPELVKVVKKDASEMGSIDAGFVPDTAELIISDVLLKTPTNVIIEMLRHELEHASQFAKVYKAKGYKAFEEAINKRYDILRCPRGKLNKAFYDEFSRNIDITDPNIERYYKGITDVRLPNEDTFEYSCRYYDNALEEGAYDISKKISQIMDSNYITARETWPRNGMELSRLMDERGCLPDEKLVAYTAMFNYKRIEMQPNSKELMEMSEKNPIEFEKFINTIPSSEEYAKIFDGIEKELKNMTKEKFQEFLNTLVRPAIKALEQVT